VLLGLFALYIAFIVAIIALAGTGSCHGYNC
jgi:hypothetical protein